MITRYARLLLSLRDPEQEKSHTVQLRVIKLISGCLIIWQICYVKDLNCPQTQLDAVF